MKNRKIIMGLVFSSVMLFACDSENNNPTSQNSSSSEQQSSELENSSINVEVDVNKTPRIFLAGDSTVKAYNENTYIGGWGQFLNYFLDPSVEVINCAEGGRSSRSFINEGRLYPREGVKSFSHNGGKSIEETITSGDIMFIQFGHNDDESKKESSYSTLYERMVPLGTPDENGIYPVTPGVESETTHLPEEYLNNVTESNATAAYTKIKNYGSTYYAYDSGGTYKWFLKQYIDVARKKGAIPVLVTPVSRVKFVGDEIIGGPGLHGEDFAYVKAVRQLAEEENCLLIDLFSKTKDMLETATSKYANYLMALKPNDLNGEWPLGYDIAYGNAEEGYTGIEATHYNKYGAYLTASFVAENIILNTEKHNSDKEYYYFKQLVKTTPNSYINPSNLISKEKVTLLEAMNKTVNVTDPNRKYNKPEDVVALIDELIAMGEVTQENYLAVGEKCEAIRKAYNSLNIDDRGAVTNFSSLEQIEQNVEKLIEANRPKPVSSVEFDVDGLTPQAGISENFNVGDFIVVASSSKPVEVKASAGSFEYNGQLYNTSNLLSLGGSADYSSGRYVQFTTTKKSRITVAAKTSSKTDTRMLALVKEDAPKAPLCSFTAGLSVEVTSYDLDQAGTFKIGSTSGGVYLYKIIIEYYE